MTPTRAAMGTFANRGAPTKIPIAKNSETLMPESRLNPPPDCTLMMLCPNRAQPPIPPVKPAAMLPSPCPTHSCLVDEVPSSIILSISCIVSKDSIAPTAAIVIAYGRTTFSVSKEKGTLEGQSSNLGSTDQPPRKVSAPETSARVLTPGSLSSFCRIEQNMTAPRVGGTDFRAEILGINLTKAAVRAVNPIIDRPAAEERERKAPLASRKCPS
mmetsp:Transcript_15664/g.43382  ORF Transcript_15664/g.43382 Transcript_15664/m.43382 type:complete len:214 (-) Transcript_15664:1010-1651(-)